MACKANSAASVRINLPLLGNQGVASPRSVLYESRMSTHYLLDRMRMCGISIITIGKPIRGDRVAPEERQQASQSPSPARRGHAESGAREGPGSKVPRWRVFRSARHRSGQVRDAAPRIGGEHVDYYCSGGIRRVEADILPNQSQLRGIGDRWISAQEEGSARPAQSTRRGARVYPGATGRGRADSSAPVGRADPEEIRSRYPPEDDRASSSGKKNRALTPDRAEGSEPLAGVTSQYEALRNAALGHALPPAARSGLSLFLRRGLWGWARVVATAGASPPQPRCGAPLSFPAAEESTTIIHIFAAMAMGAERRGATL